MEDGMIQSLWWDDRTLDQAIHTQARFYIFTSVAYLNDRMTNEEFQILTYVG